MNHDKKHDQEPTNCLTKKELRQLAATIAVGLLAGGAAERNSVAECSVEIAKQITHYVDQHGQL